MPYIVREEIEEAIQSGTYSNERLVNVASKLNYNSADVSQEIESCAVNYSKKLSLSIDKSNNENGMRSAMITVMLITALIQSLLNLTSTLYVVIAIIIALLAGFFYDKSRPLLGIISFPLFAFLFPYFFNRYFENRSSFIQIELVAPILGAAFFLLFSI